MSNSRKEPWSDNPNLPALYVVEKASFVGTLLGSILYGILIVVFFKCMAALFNPTYHRGDPIKWRLVSYTVVMFSLVTLGTVIQLDVRFISYIDNRDFPCMEGVVPPGLPEYQRPTGLGATTVIQIVTLALNNWLADGILLYRCYVIYSMNLWVIVFPSLMYLGSLAMGIAFIYQTATGGVGWPILPYLSISLSLNILLTLTIVIRLILHARNTRTALGITGIGGLCKAIITTFIESCALYSVSSLLFIGSLGARNLIWVVFAPILIEIQVIAALLIILRVANRSALTSNAIASEHISEFRARSRGGSTGGSGDIPGGDPVGSTGERVTTSYELGVWARTTDVDPHQDKI